MWYTQPPAAALSALSFQPRPPLAIPMQRPDHQLLLVTADNTSLRRLPQSLVAAEPTPSVGAHPAVSSTSLGHSAPHHTSPHLTTPHLTAPHHTQHLGGAERVVSCSVALSSAAPPPTLEPGPANKPSLVKMHQQCASPLDSNPP